MKRKINIKSIAIMIIVVGFFYAVKSQFPHYSVSSQNMFPAFSEGDIILTNSLVDKEAIKRNDVCIVNYKGDAFINRIVGLPGDEIEIKDGVLFVNNIEQIGIKTCYKYSVKLGAHSLLSAYDLLSLLIPLNQFEEYEAILTQEQAEAISKLDFVKSIQKIIHPKGYKYAFSNKLIFPNHSLSNWSRDNFGPIRIPEKGDEVGVVKITIKEKFYFVLGDSRHQSLDSRYWGLVPSTNIEGLLLSKIYSSK
jgi:signal peptidase I